MARTETGTAIDRVLRNAASGSREQLIELERDICTEIDGAVTARKGALADKWRAVSRVVYGMASLRYPGWQHISPSHARDRAALASIARNAVPLDECPVGLFLSATGDLCVMTEYATKTTSGSVNRDAYIVSTGEYFWGGAKSSADRRQVQVTPLSRHDVTAMLDAYHNISK